LTQRSQSGSRAGDSAHRAMAVGRDSSFDQESGSIMSRWQYSVIRGTQQIHAHFKFLSWLKFGLPILALLLVLAVANEPRARSQQPKAAAAQVIRRVEVGDLVRAEPQVSEQQFDAWVFRQDRTPEAARWRLDSLLELQVDEYDRACKLTAEQKQKLQ